MKGISAKPFESHVASQLLSGKQRWHQRHCCNAPTAACDAAGLLLKLLVMVSAGD